MTHRVLVVDDNPANLRLASDVLELAGFAVEKAADAEQAQDLLEHVTPDLILMDIGLPGMDGLTLTRKLRADRRFERVLVVALTAFAMKGDERKALEAGCDGYITKPFDTRRLPEQVAEFLRRGAGDAGWLEGERR